mmetsp:Transcript_14519/g.40365  ORF Transcript_14519/g.40365 Transcript_14519/m.40365 type:complete len:181 (+) Transcript_14519:19-561(+)|eukprot:CAMPEP_0172369798 /NCGR_PEP_ID=MMETSP1060-20121228/34613_1 /TAXON_ID=37318 /ORGANISM="Pseudo-nitzschia pungens, Strain cf. cingulata" /LENGTH=180 /DNA_ID=CAMNT_0013094861 /DNA_START=18 /DNA_END=557 /DNA_ORIENTATION=+
MTNSTTTYEVDFEAFLPKGSKNAPTLAEGLVLWWKTYQESGFLRKYLDCSVINSSAGCIRVEGSNDLGDAVENKIRSTMKKIRVEDLGEMQAADLLASIPEEDPQGRGLGDLRDMEKKLSVKIIFDDDGGHVYLVGDAKKLEKKTFAIRNLLSHYHWRLSGTDVSSKNLCSQKSPKLSSY